jgi:hypothetical protein
MSAYMKNDAMNYNQSISFFSYLPEPLGCCDNIVVTLPPQEFFSFPPIAYRI